MNRSCSGTPWSVNGILIPISRFLSRFSKRPFTQKWLILCLYRHFKNSLAIMCEAWLKRKGIDPGINTSKIFYTLQDEFFKVLAHINRGFERAVDADWKAALGVLINLRNEINSEPDARWLDHKEERRRGDPASRSSCLQSRSKTVPTPFGSTCSSGGCGSRLTRLQ